MTVLVTFRWNAWCLLLLPITSNGALLGYALLIGRGPSRTASASPQALQAGAGHEGCCCASQCSVFFAPSVRGLGLAGPTVRSSVGLPPP